MGGNPHRGSTSRFVPVAVPVKPACILTLAGAGLCLLAAAPAQAQTLEPGDRLVFETGAAFGFDHMPSRMRDPCTIETRLSIGIGKTDEKGMDVDVEVSLGVRAIRFAGPSFCWSLEPVTQDGFIGKPLSAAETSDLRSAVLPPHLPPLVQDLVRKELRLATVVAALHGRHVSARVALGKEPFARIDQIDGAQLGEEDRVIAERYLGASLLLAFPPVPLDLDRDSAAYEAGGSRYEVLGFRDAYWPIRGREHRVQALGRPSSAARAAFSFEAMHDTGLEQREGGPTAREWADVHASLGIAGRRQVRVVSPLAVRGDPKKTVDVVATWTSDLVRATRSTLAGPRNTRTEVPLDAPATP